jgi:hypothetical protein
MIVLYMLEELFVGDLGFAVSIQMTTIPLSYINANSFKQKG